MTKAGRVAAVAIALLVVPLSAGCNEAKKLIGEAESQKEKGDLDEALATLQVVTTRAKGTDYEKKARDLAVTWEIAAADSAASVYERRTRLEEALKWDSTSGPSQARLCATLIELKDYDRARDCLGPGLAGKANVPPDIAAKARADLAEHDGAAAAADKKRLLEGTRPQHWQAVIDRYPGTEEAREAGEKLRRYSSLCADIDSFLVPLREELERQRRLARFAKEKAGPDAGGRDERLDAYGQVAAEAAPKARAMKALAGAVEEHRVEPSDADAQRRLRAALWILSDSARVLAEGLERLPLETDDSYDSAGHRAVERWAARYGQAAGSVEKSMTEIEASCARAGLPIPAPAPAPLPGP